MKVYVGYATTLPNRVLSIDDNVEKTVSTLAIVVTSTKGAHSMPKVNAFKRSPLVFLPRNHRIFNSISL